MRRHKGMRVCIPFAAALLALSLALGGCSLKTPAAQAMEDRQYATAARLLREQLDEDPAAYEARCEYVRALYCGGEGIAAYRELAELFSRHAQAKELEEFAAMEVSLRSWYSLDAELQEIENGYVSRKQEGYRDALQAYIDAHPQNVPARYIMASELTDIGRYAEAEALLLEILGEHPQFMDAKLMLSGVYRKQEAYDKSREALEELLLANPESTRLLCARARLELQAGDYGAGLKYARAAEEIAPADETVLFTLCLACHYSGLAQERDGLLETMRGIQQYDKMLLTQAEEVIAGTYEWR